MLSAIVVVAVSMAQPAVAKAYRVDDVPVFVARAKAAFRVDDDAGVKRAVYRLVATCKAFRTGSGTPAQVVVADDATDDLLRLLATTYHQRLRDTRVPSPTRLAWTDELYKMWLTLFPDSVHHHEIRFFHAELLFSRERFDEARDEYVAAFDADPRGKWAIASVEEAARSTDEQVRARDRAQATTPTTQEPLPIPALDRQLIEDCERVLAVSPLSRPGERLAVECEYKIALTHYRHNHFDVSTPLFFAFLAAHPSAPRAATVVGLLLDTCIFTGDDAGLAAALAALKADPQLQANEDVRDFFDGPGCVRPLPARAAPSP